MKGKGGHRGSVEKNPQLSSGGCYRELPGDSPSRNLKQLSFACYSIADFQPTRWIDGSHLAFTWNSERDQMLSIIRALILIFDYQP